MGKHLPGSVALAVLLVACAREESPPVDVTDEYLNARLEVLRADVEAVLQDKLPKDLKARVVSSDEMEAIGVRDGVRMRSRIEGGPRGKELEEESRRNALTDTGHARLSLDTGEIVYCVENVVKMAEWVPTSQKLLVPERLDLALTHELVHVYQHQRGWIRPSTNWDAKFARTALVEGHAEFVTRKVAERRDLTGYLDYERAEWTGDDGGLYLENRIRASSRFSYRQGERFFAEIVARLGYREAVERLFTDPPTDTTVISWPERYFDPVPLPEGFEQVGPMVRDWLRETRPAAAWFPHTRTQIEADLGLLELDERQRALEGLVKSIAIVDSHDWTISIAWFDTDEAALLHRNMQAKLSRVIHNRFADQTGGGIQSLEHHTAASTLDGVAVQSERILWLVHGRRAAWPTGVTRLVDGPIFVQVDIRGLPSRMEHSKLAARRVLRLIRAIRNSEDQSDNAKRWIAARGTESGVERLRTLSHDEDADIRLAALESLRAVGDKTLKRAASDEDAEIRERAARWIAGAKDLETLDRVHRLVAMLEGEQDPRPLTATFEGLRELEAHRRIPWSTLRGAARHGDPALRLAAMDCWREPEYGGRAPLRETRELLLDMIHDASPQVQERASALMAELAPDLAGFPEAWLHAMKGNMWFVQSRAVDAFETLGPGAEWAVDDLVALLDREYPGGEHAALAIAAIGDSAASAEATLRALYTEGPVRNRGAYAVALARVAHDVRPLLECLDGGERSGRREVIETIGELKVGAAIPKLIELLDSEEDAREAAEALGVMGAEEAIPALERRIGKGDSSYDFFARDALAAIRAASNSN